MGHCCRNWVMARLWISPLIQWSDGSIHSVTAAARVKILDCRKVYAYLQSDGAKAYLVNLLAAHPGFGAG